MYDKVNKVNVCKDLCGNGGENSMKRGSFCELFSLQGRLSPPLCPGSQGVFSTIIYPYRPNYCVVCTV